MSQSLAKILIHLIYSTKNRSPILTADVRPELWKYKRGILENWDCSTLTIDGAADHAHLLFVLSRNHPLKKIVEEVKKGSSKWIKTQSEKYDNFHWQNGYAAFSVSQSNVEQVKQYIENQEKHHRRMTFQEEFKEFLIRHEIDFDERYVWD